MMAAESTLDVAELKAVIRVELERLEMASESAVVVLLMIAAHESGGFDPLMSHGGKALSYWQLDESQHNSVLEFVREQRPDWLAYLESINPDLDAEWLSENLRYSVCIAGIRLFMLGKPLPDVQNLVGIAQFANTYWNPHLGASSPENYLSAYQVYCASPSA